MGYLAPVLWCCIGATSGRRMTRRQIEAAVPSGPREVANLTVFEPGSGEPAPKIPAYNFQKKT